MILTISTTHKPATDLGFLLHKNPARLQSFDTSFGKAHVFYPEADEDRCTAALMLDIDPIGLVRDNHGPSGEGFSLGQYVNDRPYVASSFMSVAMSNVFRTALSGRCDKRTELAGMPIPLQATLTAVPCRGGEDLLRRLFEPLGYKVSVEGRMRDERFPEWGESRCFTVRLEGDCRLCDLLTHLYVLIPVMDDDKHYWVGEDEVEKLLKHGGEWLASHPENGLIVNRYLKHKKSLTRQALSRLLDEDQSDPDESEVAQSRGEETVEEKISLNRQRIGSIMAVLRNTDAKRVLDLGCGEGKIIEALLNEKSITEIVGMDVSYRALQMASDKLHLDRMPERQKSRMKLIQGSLIYRDRRLEGYDAAVVAEVIEHLDQPRLAAFERVLFEFAKPGTVVLTTPNIEYNIKFESMAAGKLRHRDHRFEWTRDEFRTWAEDVGSRFGYHVKFLPVGPEDPSVGAPTQMAVFSRAMVDLI